MSHSLPTSTYISSADKGLEVNLLTKTQCPIDGLRKDTSVANPIDTDLG
jgi:hypothetical protein